MNTEICLNDNFEITNAVHSQTCDESGRRIRIKCSKNDGFSTVQFVFKKEQCDFFGISYIFYGREFVMSEGNCHFKCEYGFMYPFSMMGFLSKGKALTIISDSHKIGFVELEKNDEICRCTFGFELYGEETLEFLLCEHSPCLKAGIECYRNWYTGKYGKLPGAEKSAADIFHVRRYFFNSQLCTSHILDNQNVQLDKIFNDDCTQLGGIDSGLLFDFAYDKKTGIRCGNSTVIPFNDDVLLQLQRQIKEISAKSGCKFFCYFDPYLVQNGSDADNMYRSTLPILRRDGSVCYMWGKTQWAPCVGEEEWQRFSVAFISEAAERLCCEGVYLDEFGNGSQYNCANEGHNHAPGFSQVESESEYIGVLQREITGKLWMCEFPPPDYAMNNMDIVLCDTASLINIYRFIFPKVKFIRITGCDRPLGDNVWEVNKSFFNGEGLWIDNDINNGSWYSDNVKTAIREQYFILTKYKEFFNSDSPQPLIYKNSRGIAANKFTFGDKAVVTFINSSEMDFCCRVELEGLVPIENLYHKTKISDFNENTFLLDIKSKSVGCALFFSSAE